MIPILGVPTLCRPDMLLRMLDSIDHPVGHLVIIDNGFHWPRQSALPPLEIPACVDNVTIVELPGNLGVAGAWNLIVKSTPHAPWWLIVNDDIRFPTGSLAQWAERADRDGLLLTSAVPPWCAFAIGERVIGDVGLFDERFHPAYFEDDDYERRLTAAGYTPSVGPAVEHRNSSTLDTGVGRNHVTFDENARFMQHKRATNDLTAGWDLTRRRTLAWED